MLEAWCRCTAFSRDNRAWRLVQRIGESHSSFGEKVFVTLFCGTFYFLCTFLVFPSCQFFFWNKKLLRYKFFIYYIAAKCHDWSFINSLCIYGIYLAMAHDTCITKRTVFLTFIKTVGDFLDGSIYLKFRKCLFLGFKRKCLCQDSFIKHPIFQLLYLLRYMRILAVTHDISAATALRHSVICSINYSPFYGIA